MADTRQPPYSVRMPEALRDELQREAVAAGRSLHAEVIRRLSACSSLRDDFAAKAMAALIEKARTGPDADQRQWVARTAYLMADGMLKARQS